MMEDGEWGEPDIFTFSGIFSINIIVYDAMSCSTSFLIAEKKATHTVYLLMINSNLFNSLKIKRRIKGTVSIEDLI